MDLDIFAISLIHVLGLPRSIPGLNCCWNNKRVTATLYDLGMADHSRSQEAMEITLEDLDNQKFDTNEIMITYRKVGMIFK